MVGMVGVYTVKANAIHTEGHFSMRALAPTLFLKPAGLGELGEQRVALVGRHAAMGREDAAQHGLDVLGHLLGRPGTRSPRRRLSTTGRSGAGSWATHDVPAEVDGTAVVDVVGEAARLAAQDMLHVLFLCLQREKGIVR